MAFRRTNLNSCPIKYRKQCFRDQNFVTCLACLKQQCSHPSPTELEYQTIYIINSRIQKNHLKFLTPAGQTSFATTYTKWKSKLLDCSKFVILFCYSILLSLFPRTCLLIGNFHFHKVREQLYIGCLNVLMAIN